ncbi:MAG: hypothetical protein Q9M91_00755 [Candidatus Dojkabacteria bacterium]|nr:hypothetical protein [Candidatus Dojkabacteria bacterium]MDQ7020358.1 hypothetical protein [Candidatus Dojkabacteria bacterium]
MADFRPHITVAYVNKDFELPAEYDLGLVELKVSEIRVSKHSDFVKKVKEAK